MLSERIGEIALELEGLYVAINDMTGILGGLFDALDDLVDEVARTERPGR